MSSLSPSASSASVRNILTLLASRDAQLVAGASGLEHRVTWACRMRARLPAFESIQGGELALLTLSQLRRLDETLPHLLKTLHKAGVAVVAVAALAPDALGNEAKTISDELHLPLIFLPASTQLEEIEREVITFVVSFRGEIERKSIEIAHQLMQLSVQGAGIQGICEYLAVSRGKWVVVQDAQQHIRLQAAPPSAEALILPPLLTSEHLRTRGLARVVEPVMIRHEIVGYLSLVGNEDDFDYLERIILGQVTPILALAVARERERSEVESRYLAEAFTDVLQGHYQQPEEMLARTRLLGYDLSGPQAAVLYEVAPGKSDYPEGSPLALWGKRVRDELLRIWPTCWVLSESRRVTALLPLSTLDGSPENEREWENAVSSRLERVQSRLSSSKDNGTESLIYSCGIGRIAKKLEEIPQSAREAQQALEIGRRLFGEGKIHSFARLGVYRLLFYLDGQRDLESFYQETLGPLLNQDSRNDNTLLETLEGFFRCNGNLSETARAMHLHRNSLLYRLGRIEEILGASLDDPELRLSLQIALKIHHLQKR
ncbi:MAG TPA: helix-turn-helix domain-containing protein [Ktedonosporobacter sp.]|jgi:purine catabolism regulator|nr:helix-turn-helix domain-containing protein [Ktedonosporobacter sp.]